MDDAQGSRLWRSETAVAALVCDRLGAIGARRKSSRPRFNFGKRAYGTLLYAGWADLPHLR